MQSSSSAVNLPSTGGDAGAQPKKCIKDMTDMMLWQRSQAYYDLMGFINGISIAVQGKRINSAMHISDSMKKLLQICEELDKYIDETPPLPQPQRFGNQAYRDWAKKMRQKIHSMLENIVPIEKFEAINELAVYVAESFGNAVRIDYGTGHEMSFVMFLCCLYKLNILVEMDNVACALKLFYAYLILVRKLQKTYRMEPAGSQGVWSLDDYQFLPFIWGSAQLSLNAPFEPAKFLDPEIINKYKDEYMFISCIDFISQVKTGHFAEHSNQLWSISAVHSWAKINSGLVKMYQKEILAKFPVAQHIFFGSLMPFTVVTAGATIATARLGLKPLPKGLFEDDDAASTDTKSEIATSIVNEGDSEVATTGKEATTSAKICGVCYEK